MPFRLQTLIRSLYCLEVRQFRATRSGTESDYGVRPMPRWDGGRDPRTGNVYRPIWDAIAAFVTKHKLVPAILFRSVFLAWTDSQPPAPNFFCSASCRPLYDAYLCTARERYVAELRSEKLVWAAESRITAHLRNCSLEQSAAEALQNPQLQLSALFRYAIARQAGMACAERYFEPALQQYFMSRALYDEVWETLVPSDLRKHADKIANEISTGRETTACHRR